MAIFCPPQDYVFFADEAGISQDRFTVVGGICLHRSSVAAVRDNIAAFREKRNMRAELKWSRISEQKCEDYKELVNFFFALNNTNHLQFHSIVFDSHQANHRKFNDGDRDLGLSKLYYQLILWKFINRCGNDGSLCVVLDHRNSSTSLHDLKDILNHGARKSCGNGAAPVKQLLSLDSRTDDMLQLNDVILGAVCAARNGKHRLVTGRASKREIAELVLDKSGLHTFDRDSPRDVHRFTVWNMRPQPR